MHKKKLLTTLCSLAIICSLFSSNVVKSDIDWAKIEKERAYGNLQGGLFAKTFITFISTAFIYFCASEQRNNIRRNLNYNNSFKKIEKNLQLMQEIIDNLKRKALCNNPIEASTMTEDEIVSLMNETDQNDFNKAKKAYSILNEQRNRMIDDVYSEYEPSKTAFKGLFMLFITSHILSYLSQKNDLDAKYAN